MNIVVAMTMQLKQEEHFNDDHTSKHHEETLENLKSWLSIDSATTASVGMNEDIFHSIEKAKDPSGTIGDAGKLDLHCTAEMNGVGRMSFNENGSKFVWCE